MNTAQTEKQTKWFVMRDLKRANAKLPAYKMLLQEHFEVFVPMKSRVITRGGGRHIEKVPVLRDLLFVHSDRESLDPVVEKTPTLQYRFLRNSYCAPMTVPDAEMERFITAVTSSDSAEYYSPEEITPKMYNRKIRIIGGNLDGYEGYLLTVRGSKTRRLLVELPGLLAAGVEVSPEYIVFI